MKYRSDRTLKELIDIINQVWTTNKESGGIDVVMKQKLQIYNNTKNQLITLLRKQEGNLSTRSLNEVVKKEHFVLDSEYLTTLLVAVPKYIYINRNKEKDWLDEYETLVQMVVPRSSTY
jgi:V-type H+-transporting ATPase subunit C